MNESSSQAVARLVAGRPELWERYGGWLASLHPAAYEEVQGMARRTRKPLRLDLTPIVKSMGMDWVIEQLGPKRVIEQLGTKRCIEELGGVRQFWAEMTPEQRRELRRLVEENPRKGKGFAAVGQQSFLVPTLGVGTPLSPLCGASAQIPWHRSGRVRAAERPGVCSHAERGNENFNHKPGV
jgi:hypothetical protein